MPEFIVHGFARRGQKTKTYNSWQGMLRRCDNRNLPGWKNYGGRGIAVCDRWRHSFPSFLADMGERPPGLTLERRNNDGNYEPGNCYWATRKEQSDNRRRLPHQKLSREQHLAVAADPRSIYVIAIEYGVVPQTVHKIKLRYGGVILCPKPRHHGAPTKD